jgi:DNA-binding NarL/FixJ family response regulator
MNVIRVLIVDDQPLLRFGLKMLILTADDLVVMGEAESGEAAIAQVQAEQPDLIVMDIKMPGIGGIEATRQITADWPDIAVLMLTIFEDDETVFVALRAGASGYILKESDPAEILRAIHAVGHGEAIFGPGIAKKVLEYFKSPRQPAAEKVFPELSERELEILTLIARGVNNATIAQQLVITPKTVRNHITSIFSKLHVADRANAILRAKEQGLG